MIAVSREKGYAPMHEVGLCEDILGAVERRAEGRRVTGVRVRIGSMHRVHEPALAQAFELVAAGTLAEGATIDIVPVSVQVLCRGCGTRTETDDLFARCPLCESADLDVSGGDELMLESIRVATSDTPNGRSADVPGHRG